MKQLIRFMIFILCSMNTHAKPLTLMLDWYLNPNHAPILVAMDQGYFKHHGLEVKLLTPADPMDTIKLVASGFADVGISYQSSLTIAAAQGLPVRRTAALIKQSLNCLMVKKSGPIQHLTQLKDRRIAYAGGQATIAILSKMLKQVHLQLSDVTLINVHFNLSQALLSNQVDAVIGVSCNYEPMALALENIPSHTFAVTDFGVPPHEGLVFITHSSLTNDARINAFIAALNEATQYLKQNPQAAWLTTIKHHPQLKSPLNHTVWLRSIHYFSTNPQRIDKKAYQTFANFLKEYRIISKIPKNQDYL